MIKRFFFAGIIILTVFSIILLIFKEHRREVFRDGNVVVQEKSHLLDWINVHGYSRPKRLIIGGKVFEGVMGSAPFYLDVPQINAIFFATQDSKGGLIFHIAKLDTGEVVNIDGKGVVFAGHIGGPQKPGEPFTDYIENAHDNKVVLAKYTDSYKDVITLNLKARCVERVETIHLLKEKKKSNP